MLTQFHAQGCCAELLTPFLVNDRAVSRLPSMDNLLDTSLLFCQLFLLNDLDT